ncbi:MAG: ABC transporter ATP-binding protein [Tenericutes bacterium]|nr:ABC transporter ATP-binding protein [Mycoplasmatota bacterium]
MENKYSTLDVFKFHIKVFKEDKELYVIWYFILHMIVSGSLPLLFVIFPKYVIDSISIGDVNQTIMYILIFGASLLVFSVLQLKLYFKASGRFIASRVRRGRTYNNKFRNAEFKHLEDANFHQKRDEGFETMSHAFYGFQGTLRIVFTQMPEIFSIIGFILILGLFNPIIVLIAFGCAILQFFISLKSKNFAVANHKELAERRRVSNYYYRIAHDNTYGKDIRINDLSKPLTNRYKQKAGLVNALLKEINIFEYRFSLFEIIFLLITNGLTYLIVIKAYFNGSVSIGTISMTIMTILMITVKLQNTFREVSRLKTETNKTKKYMSFFDDDYSFEEETDDDLVFDSMTIEFRNVSFKYPVSDKYVLNNISFKIDAGKKIALVGINGSGKSTIVKLLSGLYKPNEGDILINGISTKDMNLRSYRKNIAVVFQEVNIYAASLLENITGENPTEIDRECALKALKQVGLYEKIMGYELMEDQQMLKVVDENGTDLSGGEAQKLAISRALYKQNTKLIILDEPTSSLDAIAEREMYEHFNELVDGRTAVMISHRLASTKFCDDILFIEAGVIKEHGNHEELMKLSNGLYKEMFITQGKYYQEEKEFSNETK